MNINRHNYEAFFLDHVEGRLSSDQEIELMEFLSLNPDLAAELTEYESIRLDKENITFNDKEGIKKKTGALTPVEQLIALMEGDLTPQETSELKKKIQSDKYLQTQSELLLKTKLIPDASIRFPNKNKLKRTGKVVYMWRYVAAAAAIIIIGLTFVFRNIPDKKQNETVAQKSTPALPIPSAPVKEVIKQEKPLADNKKPVTQSLTKEKTNPGEKVTEQTDIITPLASNEIVQQVNNVVPVQVAPAKENVQPVLASENTFNPGDIFTEAEWNELQNMNTTRESRLQEVAREGLNRLGELTGVQVHFPNKEKRQDVFAFSVGNFEVRHVPAK
jgi:hypothetical protein